MADLTYKSDLILQYTVQYRVFPSCYCCCSLGGWVAQPQMLYVSDDGTWYTVHCTVHCTVAYTVYCTPLCSLLYNVQYCTVQFYTYGIFGQGMFGAGDISHFGCCCCEFFAAAWRSPGCLHLRLGLNKVTEIL
jgi:hypothetical protein